MSKTWQRDSRSGLVTPTEPDPTPEPKRGPLEFINDADRREAHKHFGALINMVQPDVFCVQANQAAMEQVLRNAAKLLLGDDVDFEILT